MSEVTGSGAQAPQPGGDRAGGPDRTPGPRVGLCETCVHQRVVRNTRGSSFSLCERSRSDPAYPRYPRVPVLECAGHEPGGTGETG